MKQWKWTHCVRLVPSPAFDIVPVAARLVRIWARMRRTLSRVWAGDRRVLPEALHIFSLPFVRYQILYFLTEELLNSLSDKHKKNRIRFLKKRIKCNRVCQECPTGLGIQPLYIFGINKMCIKRVSTTVKYQKLIAIIINSIIIKT